MLPSFSDLMYFVEVAGVSNISRAAERLGLSQPSLTLSIQRLEESLGTPVLIRNKRGVTLTQAGKQLLAQSRFLLQTWDQVRGQALASVDEIQGSYAIGCHPSVALYSLSLFLPDLLGRYPKLNIKLRHDLSRKISEEIISSSIDLGIVVNPVRHPDLVIHKLCEDAVTLWRAPAKSPLLDPRSGRAVLICDPDLIQSQTLMKKFKTSGILIDRTVTSGSLEVIAELTASGCGLGILPTRVARRAPGGGLKKVPYAPAHLDEISLVYRVENKNVRSIREFAAAIKRALN